MKKMSARFEKGRKIRAEVLGEETVRRRLDGADDFNRDFQELITEFCWGAGWGRHALSRRDRSLLNIGMLSALNRPEEFALHVKAAVRNGLTPAELEDALIQVGIYCGIPAGVEAFRIASRVLEQLDSDESIR
ncbi:MAG TPA: carboxymuconolactone decarboxylase family protein [Steroidobacteraceae bacterium]|nr:carboxymuconolactone decarboxylase family protein [Steroidobacteraceae bacterium]